MAGEDAKLPVFVHAVYLLCSPMKKGGFHSETFSKKCCGSYKQKYKQQLMAYWLYVTFYMACSFNASTSLG